MEFANVNWLAVIVGTVAAFLLGWLVYSPILFGKKWAEGSGVEMNTADKMPVFAMIAQLIALLALGVTATSDAFITAILSILAAALFVTSNGGFCRKSGYAITVDFGYVFAAGIVMIIAQGIF